MGYWVHMLCILNFRTVKNTATSDHGILELRQFLEKMREVLKRMQTILLRRLDDIVDRCTGLRASRRVSIQPVFSPNDKRLESTSRCDYYRSQAFRPSEKR